MPSIMKFEVNSNLDYCQGWGWLTDFLVQLIILGNVG